MVGLRPWRSAVRGAAGPGRSGHSGALRTSLPHRRSHAQHTEGDLHDTASHATVSNQMEPENVSAESGRAGSRVREAYNSAARVLVGGPERPTRTRPDGPDHKIDAKRGVESCVTAEQFEYASSIRFVKALEWYKRVRAALRSFEKRGKKEEK